jgi:hypothetical protein
MRRYLFVLLLLFPAAAGAQPAIEFQAERHDFGTVVQGPMLEYSFEFRNAGTEDLIIRDVGTS